MSISKIEILTEVPGPKSRSLWEEREKYVPRGVSNSTKVFAAEGDGALVRDVDGNVFVDFASGIGVLNAGYCPVEVVDAIKAQSEKFLHTGANVLWYEGYTAVAKRLSALAPIPDAKVMLVNCGAEAVENAVKIARKFTGRTGIVTVGGSFHGRTLLTLSLTTKYRPYKDGFGPYIPDVYRLPCPDLFRKPENVTEEEFVLSCADALEELLNMQSSPEAIACVIVEPVQGEGGFVPMPNPYLKRLREICSKHGIVFVADEIQSGIARTGTFFAIEQFGIEPDIITSAKSLAAGLPLGAVIGRAEIMDSPQIGGIGGTFSGNPVACAAALAVLDNIEKYGLRERAAKIGAYIMERIHTMMRKFPQIGDARGMGAMRAMEFVKDRRTKEPDSEIVHRVIDAALKRGAIFLNAGLYSNVIRFLPPLVMTDEQLAFGMDVLEAAIQSAINNQP